MARLSTKHKRFLRAELRKIYGNKCIYCGCDLTRRILTIEHFVPRSQGGTNHLDNLRPACEFCNSTHANPLEAKLRPRNKLTYEVWARRNQKDQYKRSRWVAPCFPVA